MRASGSLYQKVEDHSYSNLYNYHVINKTSEELPITFKLETAYGEIKLIGNPPIAPKNGEAEGVLFIQLPKENIDGRKNKIKVEVYTDNELVDEVYTNFYGPVK